MSQKRQQEEVEEAPSGERAGEKRPKGFSFRQVVNEAVTMNRLQTMLSTLEPLLRRVVKEEVESALTKHLLSFKRQCGKQIYPSTSMSLQLQFRSALSLPIFTAAKIEGEDNSQVCIDLVDAVTGDAINSGPESSLKVEVVVLEGDFEGTDDDNWTFEEFKNNIVREREGKRALLTGDTFTSLNEGTAVISELAFTDNSSWTRSRKFRLGARVENGYFKGTRIKEARTGPFVVKDHRGELYKKHYPPSLEDDVWRLEKIGKDGAFHKRLSRERINTVKDFLMLLSLDSPRLRNILGAGMSGKMWDVTVEHARTCTLSNKLYAYYQNQQNENGIVFNDVGELKGSYSKNQYVPFADLSDISKAEAQKLVKVAYEHQDDILLLNAESLTGCSPHTESFSSISQSPLLGESLFFDSSKTDMFSFPLSSVSTPDMGMFPLGDNYMDSINMESSYASSFASNGAHKTSLVFPDVDSCGQVYFAEGHSPFFGSGTYQNSDAEFGNVVCECPPDSNNKKVHKRWRILISLLIWRISIKRIVASKRRAFGKR